MGVGTLGRKKKRMEDRNRKPVAITIKGDPAWRAWVESLARHMRLPVSLVIEHSLLASAKASGFDAPPPPRLPDLAPGPVEPQPQVSPKAKPKKKGGG
jgi:hypothetical protein